MDQPIMSLSDIDLSPGFVTQLSVTPTLHETTDQGKGHGTKSSKMYRPVIVRSFVSNKYEFQMSTSFNFCS